MLEQEKQAKSRGGKYNLEAIRSAADALLVAESIGMDIDRSGRKRPSVLCPGHDDKHHGSCYITARGCRCFVCNKDYDVFEMVMLHCGVRFYEAAGVIADLCGGRERFLMAADAGKPDARLLNRRDMDLIGIYNTSVYAVREIVPDYAEPPLQKGFRHEWYPGDPDKNEENYVVIEECVCKNPLWTLLDEDPDEYNRLIRDKAGETLLACRVYQKEAYQHSRSLARDLAKDIRRIEEIYIEHDGSLRELDSSIRSTDPQNKPVHSDRSEQACYIIKGG